jgi:aarF domain-containing kinase
MRTAGLFGRLCFRRGATRLPPPRSLPRLFSSSNERQWHREFHRWTRSQRKGPIVGTVVFAAALSPAAFLDLAGENGDQKTGEMRMLEASRNEIEKKASENVGGLTRITQEIYVFLFSYIYEPIATGVRFFHLAIIFLPVLATVPVIWCGRRNPNRNGERSGTLWWFDFLVCSMERAGPAFIKVRTAQLDSGPAKQLTQFTIAGPMGCFQNRYIPS